MTEGWTGHLYFPPPETSWVRGWGSEDYRVSHIVSDVSPLRYPEEISEGAGLTFPIIWSFSSYISPQSRVKTADKANPDGWSPSLETITWVPCSAHRSQPGSEVVRRMLLAFLSAPVWHLGDLSSRALSVCHLDTAGSSALCPEL